jgi:hypothetical protein
MLSKQEKIKLYGLITSEFKVGIEYPLAKVALYLTNQGLNYQEFGYKKMKNLLMDLPEFLTLDKTEDGNGQANTMVRVHLFAEPNQQNSRVETKKKKTKATNPKPTKKPAFSEDVKSNIKALLEKDFQPETPYPMSKISKYLTDHEVNYKELGFSKMLLLYEAMPEFFKINVDSQSKDGQSYLTLNFKKNKEVKKPLAKKEVKPKAKKENKKPNKADAKPSNQENKKPENKKPENDTVYLPEKLILSLKEQYSIGLPNEEISKRILNDYQRAKKTNSLVKKEDAFAFSLSLKGRDGTALIGAVKKTSDNNDYGYYVNFVGADKEKAKDYLKNRVYFSDLDKSIESLAKLAKKEAWCYHNSFDKYIILKIYLQYTFYRIIDQKKLASNPNSEFLAFNTGLVTKDYEAIYGVLMKSNDKKIKEPYIFQGFTIAANQGLGKIIVELFNPLPKKATYVESYRDYFYDPESNLHTDYGHIILDNLDRFPLSFLGTMILPFKEERQLLKQIIECKSDFKKERLYEILEDKVGKNEALFNLLKISLAATIDKAVRMVRDDYRMALPSFFPTREVMSIMLPLEFDKGEGIQAVLLIEKTQSGNYQGQTIFTLKQCYCNARLLGSLENTYLDPSKIED